MEVNYHKTEVEPGKAKSIQVIGKLPMNNMCEEHHLCVWHGNVMEKRLCTYAVRVYIKTCMQADPG